MRIRKLTAYVLVLAALLLFAWAGITMGDSRAHYQNVDSWYTVVYPTDNARPVSNCLVSGGQTVLLGSMELAEKEIPFSLRGEGVVSGSLEWTVSSEEYLGVELYVNGVLYTPDTALTLDAAEKEVTLKLIPTQVALETLHPAMELTVEVFFACEAGDISGVFTVTMPENTQLPEPTVPETTVPEETEPQTTQPAETQPEETTPQEEQPVLLTETEPATEPTTAPTTEPATEPTTTPTTEPATEPTTTPTTEPVTEPTTTPTTEPATEPTTAPTTVPATEPARSTISLSGVTEMIPGYALPVTVTVEEDVDTMILSLENERGEKTILPPFTRFSADGGESWFLLYYGGQIHLPVPDTRQVTVLLDFSVTDVPDSEKKLRAEAYQGETLTGISYFTVSVGDPLDTQAKILTETAPLTLSLPEAWRGCDMRVTVFRLTESKETVNNDNGTTTSRIVRTFVEVPLSEATLTAAHNTGSDTEPTNTLTLRTGTPKENEALWQTLPAGTYRVSLSWSQGGVCFAQEQITFFINYSTDAVP